MIDPTGRFITETRDDPTVHDLVGDGVRGFQPTAPEGSGPGRFVPHVIVETGPTQREKQVPVQHLTMIVKCAGTSPENAQAIYRAVSDRWHGTRPFLFPDGLGFYISFDEGGGATEYDPDTKQPFVSAIVSLSATTQAVTV